MLFPFNLLPQFGSGHNAGILPVHLVTFIHFTINPPGNTADLVAPWCVVPGWMLALGYDIILCSMIITLGSSQASLADSSIDQGLCIRKVCTIPDAYTGRVVIFRFSQKHIRLQSSMIVKDQCQEVNITYLCFTITSVKSWTICCLASQEDIFVNIGNIYLDGFKC